MMDLSYDEITRYIVNFIQGQVAAAGASGVVFGLSGGVDSAVTAHLCSRALGSNSCLALIMPNSEFTPSSETKDGILVATSLSIPYIIKPLQHMVRESVAHDQNPPKVASGNLNARLRAALLYYEAQKHSYLVVGTDDRSEHMLGYFTKYGDGACDMLPIVSLYKTQVWDLARYVGVPRHIIEKEPGPHLWADHLASSELGLGYADIDRVLQRLYDEPTQVSADTNIPLDRIHDILRLHKDSAHKRTLPPMATLTRDASNPTIYKKAWGSIEQLTRHTSSGVNILHLNPESIIEIQKSHSRLWRVINGSAVVVMDDRDVVLSEGSHLFIPHGISHKTFVGSKGAQILEVIT
ncbi:MAG: NAD+ synthase [Cenarchaeum sp. SB0665_bin_23]|nr:NAD+ synthase [Cenarchaeum sp. SB0667_bin_13]MXY61760.1 NAD+ synthase [Cenarchaeum sp. SB0665_bin_23]MYC80029.1 NAD+ synthase [Cenarchaeum sp. SB0661_bin_35]MYG32733.1 NAD+ synthase [Cenarchaeum sp. SB0677_bin_16]